MNFLCYYVEMSIETMIESGLRNMYLQPSFRMLK